MSEIKLGDLVGIPCNVGQGAFPGERLVTFDTTSGPVSGFVAGDELLNIEGSEALLRGIVVDLDAHQVAVRVTGSFFTTTGLAYLERDWATSHLQAI